jgi:hypothetical protein
MEKALADYQAQADRPFDHEARMKDLLARQAQLNAALEHQVRRSIGSPNPGAAAARGRQRNMRFWLPNRGRRA